MKIKKIVVLGEVIDIRLVSEEEVAKKIGADPDSFDSYGCYVPIDRTIYINKSLEPDQIRKTLIHELIHANLSISGLSNILEDKLEEAVCTALENMYNLFNNKEFVNELQNN